MPDEARASKPMQEMQLKLAWSGGSDLDPMFVDQAHLARIEDQFYLTFGQVRVTSAPISDQEPAYAEIRPMVRLVIPKEAMARLLELLQGGLTPDE